MNIIHIHLVIHQAMQTALRRGMILFDPTAAAVLPKKDVTEKTVLQKHQFATNALKYGMDVKTLATTIGHASAETTLDIYSHVTDDMKKQAADKIEYAISGKVPSVPEKKKQNREIIDFKPYTGKIRKRGSGCISRINNNTWEGRYAPKINGKRVQRVVYAHSEEECEEKLKDLISEMNAERAHKI